MLAIHYLLTVRWNFGELRLKNEVEKYMLIIPPIVGLGLSLPQIFLKYYNDTNLWCWIKASWEYEDAVSRSYNARWAFAYGPLWAFISFITMAQIYLWWTVRKIEKRVQRFQSFHTARHQSRQSRSVAIQAALYVAVFYVTNLPYTTIAATQRFYNPHTTGGFCALLAVVVCAPFQGFLNLFVYRRNQIASVSRDATRRFSAKIKRGLERQPNSPDEDSNSKHGGECLEIKAEEVKATDEEAGGTAKESKVTEKEEADTPEAEECDPLVPSHVSEVYED